MNAAMPHQIPPQYRAQAQAQAQAQAHVQQQHMRMHQTLQKRGQHAPPQPQKIDERAMRLQEAQQAALQAEAEKRRTYVPTDKTMPPGIKDLVIGDGVEQYERLREVERKLDTVMLRKRLDLQDPLQNRSEKQSTLKIWISNTVENQPWQIRGLDENTFDFNIGDEATYKVKIIGRVWDEEEQDQSGRSQGNERPQGTGDGAMEVDGAKENGLSNSNSQPKKRVKFSHFFKAIAVDFDRNKSLQPDNMTQVEWKKPRPPQPAGTLPGAPLPPDADFDCLEFERKSDENINCTINLFRDDMPERFQLSKELSDLVDMDEADRETLVQIIWEYVKLNGLQHEEEKRYIRCDARMGAVFRTQTIFFPDLQKLLEPHLRPAKPIALPYTIRCDQEFHSNPKPTIYVLRIPTPTLPASAAAAAAPPSSTNPSAPITAPDPNNPNAAAAAADPSSSAPKSTTEAMSPAAILAALTDKPTLQTLRDLDAHIALLMQALSASQTKHAFLSAMAADPAGFTKRWMASQRRDLETVLGESGRFEGDWSTGRDRDALRGEWLRGGDDGVWGRREVEEAVAVMVAKKGADGRNF